MRDLRGNEFNLEPSVKVSVEESTLKHKEFSFVLHRSKCLDICVIFFTLKVQLIQ